MTDYSFWVGLWKAVKNNLIIALPVLIAIQAQVPTHYAWVPGVVVYLIKNAIQVNME